MEVPCGQCIGCRLEHAKSWAIRCYHESQMHEKNSFITLTYEKLPEHGSLNKKHFQDFMKRLRKKIEPIKIRFFHCGEYGEKFSRPHYHALIFGYDFPDKIFFNERNKNRVYRSQELTETWGLGHCEIGAVTFKSAGYVARYILKKQNGAAAHDHYINPDKNTGEILGNLQPEYVTMSNRPGIGAKFFEKYEKDIFPDDFVVIEGRQHKTPNYYRQLFARTSPEAAKILRDERIEYAIKHKDDNTHARLFVREQVKQAQIRALKRTYENET